MFNKLYFSNYFLLLILKYKIMYILINYVVITNKPITKYHIKYRYTVKCNK